jgi:DNA-binding NarL/FixJ family response regulator
VVLVEDHPLLADLLAEVLNRTGEFDVVGKAANGEEARALLGAMQADLVLLDLVLPGMSGLELLRELRRGFPAVRTVVFSGVATEESVGAAFGQGAVAYIEKRAGMDELLGSLRAVVRGDFPADARGSGGARAAWSARAGRKDLAPVDLEILRRLAARQTAGEIAAELSISRSGVYKARARIVARLELAGCGEIPTAAANLGLIAGPVEAEDSTEGHRCWSPRCAS